MTLNNINEKILKFFRLKPSTQQKCLKAVNMLNKTHMIYALTNDKLFSTKS